MAAECAAAPESAQAPTEATPAEATPGERLQIVRLRNELEQTRKLLRDAEETALTSNKMIELIGSIDCSKIGESASWLTPPEPAADTIGIPVLFFSDWHFDEVVDPAQIGFVNAYNREIAEARARQTFLTTVRLTKRHMVNPKYEGIVLALGGDLLSGNIHEELRESNEASINMSLLRATDILIEGIELLLAEFGRVFVPCVVGNHGRIDKKPRAKNRVFDNYEWLIYQYLARHFKSRPEVSFYIPDGPDALFQIYGKRFMLTHGDQFKGGSGISGILTPLSLGFARKQKRQQAIGQPFDIMMFGHWHQYIHTQNLIGNGSLKGLDEYAFQGNFGYEPPQQSLFIVHPDHGITFRMPVLCDPQPSREVQPTPLSVIW